MNKRIASNAASMLAVQAASFVLPLATFPYLVRVLGSVGFGRYSMAIAFASFMQFVVEFGFNLSGTGEVARIRHDSDLLQRHFWSVTFAKLMLALPTFAGLQVMNWFLSGSLEIFLLNLAACISAAGTAFFPTWIFQGLERMKLMSGILVTLRVLSALGVFALVSGTTDLLRFILFQAAIAWIAVVWGHAMLFRWVLVRSPWGQRLDLSGTLRTGIPVFLSQIGVLLISNTCVLVLGWTRSEKDAGLYSIAEKLVRAASSLTSPLTLALFPHAAKTLQENRDQGLHFLRKALLWTLPSIGAGSLLLWILADFLVRLVAGKELPGAVTCLRIMAIVPFTVFLDNFYGTQLLLNLGHSRRFMMGTMGGALMGLVLQVILIPWLGAVGAASAYLGAELAVLGLFVYSTRRIGAALFPRLGI